MTIPRDEKLRKMVIPSGPGRVLVKPDYGQLEMRIVAALSGDERFIAAFQPGMPDFFVTMLPDVFPDVDFSEMTPAQMKKSHYRTLVKPFSHGLNYGRGYRAIAKELKMDEDDAFRIASNYLGPEGEGLNAWQEQVKRKAVEGEDIVTPYGFHLQSELVTRQNRNRWRTRRCPSSPRAWATTSASQQPCGSSPSWNGWTPGLWPQSMTRSSWMLLSSTPRLIGEMMEREMLPRAPTSSETCW